MKKIAFLVMAMLLTGCTANYNLEISNNSFKEKIDVYIDKSEIPKDLYPGEVTIDDPITPFLEGEYSPFFSKSDAYYDKTVTEFDDYYDVNMKYEYTSKEFSDSNALNLCFEKFEFNNSKSYYIHAFGRFSCLYGESININIKTNNKVLISNADSVDGNIYTWNIDYNNVDNVDIKFEVEKGLPYKEILKYSLIIIISISIIIGCLYLVTKKNKENNKI